LGILAICATNARQRENGRHANDGHAQGQKDKAEEGQK
jgi:hypothetical protein